MKQKTFENEKYDASLSFSKLNITTKLNIGGVDGQKLWLLIVEIYSAVENVTSVRAMWAEDILYFQTRVGVIWLAVSDLMNFSIISERAQKYLKRLCICNLTIWHLGTGRYVMRETPKNECWAVWKTLSRIIIFAHWHLESKTRCFCLLQNRQDRVVHRQGWAQ